MKRNSLPIRPPLFVGICTLLLIVLNSLPDSVFAPLNHATASLAGLCIGLLGRHTLFRVTHVIWTAFRVNEIEPFHQTIYLLGQYLLPFLLWLLTAGRPVSAPEKPGWKAVRFMPLLLLFLVPAWPAGAWGEATVAVLPNERGGFILRADGLDGVTAGEIRLSYETDGPAAPQVSPVGLGATASLQAIIDSYGTIVIRLTSPKPLRGGGYLAMIQLAGPEGGVGRVSSLFAVLRNDKGVEKMAGTRIDNPPPEEKKQAPAAARPRFRPRVTPPAPDPPEAGTLTEESVSPAPSPAPLLYDPPQRQDPLPFRRLAGVLDRFRTHAGERTAEALARLFVQAGNGEFRQEPAVLLSDGVAEVRLAIRPAGQGEEVNCFIIRGGRFTSLLKGEGGGWVLGLVPDRGTVAASVTVQTTKSAVEYPLTVAPPLSLFDFSKEGRDDSRLVEFVRMANERVLRHPAGESRNE